MASNLAAPRRQRADRGFRKRALQATVLARCHSCSHLVALEARVKDAHAKMAVLDGPRCEAMVTEAPICTRRRGIEREIRREPPCHQQWPERAL